MVKDRDCMGCNGAERVETRKYLGPRCWERIPVTQRVRLNRKDAKALERYIVLVDQLENGVTLECIVVPA